MVRLQCLWRSKLARRELRRRRQAARAADKILQDKKDLEARVAELQRILEQARVERSNFRQHLRVGPALAFHMPSLGMWHLCLRA